MTDVAGGLSIGSVIAHTGDVVVTVENTAAPDDDLTLDGSAQVQATTGSVVLRGGDSIDLDPGSEVRAQGTVTLSGDAPRTIEFVLGAVDEAGGAILLAGHTLAVGNVVTYSYRSRFGAIGGLAGGARYKVSEVDGDWIRLQEEGAAPGDPAIALHQGQALGLHAFTDDDGRVFEVVLGRVDDAGDVIHVEDHGLGARAWYRNAGGGIDGLQPEAWYKVDAHDEHSFSLREATTNTLMDVSGHGTAVTVVFADQDADNGEGAMIDVRGGIEAVSLRIEGGLDRDTIDVGAVQVPTVIDAGAGDDDIRIGDPDTGLTNAGTNLAAVTVIGGSGGDTLTLDDSGRTGAAEGVVTGTAVTGFGLNAGDEIRYEDIERVDIDLGSGGSEVTVEGTQPGVVLSIRGGSAGDTFTVGAGTLGSLDGLVEIRARAARTRSSSTARSTPRAARARWPPTG